MKRLYLKQSAVPLDQPPMVNMDRAAIEKLRGNWPQRYLVTKVIGSLKPKIDTYLSEEQAEGYCTDADWHVEIT